MQATSKQGVLIIRVSDAKQEREGLSLDNQEQVLRAYAESAGIKIAKEFRFQESADLKIRSHFKEVIDYVKARKHVTCIVGYRVDRMTRNYRDHVLLDELRLNAGKELHFVHDRLVVDHSTVGRDIQEWDTKVYLAKMQLNRIKEDSIISHRYKIERGEFPTRAPFGYRNVRENYRSNVVIEPYEAGIVGYVFELYSTGAFSMSQVCKAVEAKYQYPMKIRKVDSILTNPFYYGEMRSKGRRHRHIYAPVIPYGLFERVELVKEKFQKHPVKYAGLEFLYRGVVQCGECGCSLTGERKRKPSGKEYSYYHCTQYRGKHGAAWIREEALTSEFQSLFDRLHMPDDVFEEAVRVLREAHKASEGYSTTAKSELLVEKAKLEQRIKTLYEDRLDNVISKTKYLARVAEFEDSLSKISFKLQDRETFDADYFQTATYFLRVCQKAGTLFKKALFDEKRVLLKLVLQNSKLSGGNLLWELKKPFDLMLNYNGPSSWYPHLDAFRHKSVQFDVSEQELKAILSCNPLA